MTGPIFKTKEAMGITQEGGYLEQLHCGVRAFDFRTMCTQDHKIVGIHDHGQTDNGTGANTADMLSLQVEGVELKDFVADIRYFEKNGGLAEGEVVSLRGGNKLEGWHGILC